MLPLLLAAIPGWGSPFRASLADTVDRILADPKLRGAVAAVTVADREGHLLFDRRGHTHMVPASNMKLFSNAFALYELGPDAHGETRIWKEPNRTVVRPRAIRCSPTTRWWRRAPGWGWTAAFPFT